MNVKSGCFVRFCRISISLKNKKKEWRLTDMMCNSVIFVRNKIETKLSTERIYEDVGTNHLILIYTEITY